MTLDQIIRNIVDERIAAAVGGHADDPVLLTADEVAALHPHLGKDLIYSLCRDSSENGFPCVRIGEKRLLIDKARLNNWIRTGGLGAKV